MKLEQQQPSSDYVETFLFYLCQTGFAALVIYTECTSNQDV